MSANEKNEVKAGLTIVTRPPPAAKDGRAHVLSTIEDVDSTYTSTPLMTPTTLHAGQENPPLYLNPTTSLSNTASFENQRTGELKQATVYESDIEAGFYKSNVTVVNTNDDSKVWPCRSTLMQRYKRDKRKRQNCNPLKNLDKRTKIYVKLIIILIFVGGAIGLGIGISKAVGGGIWKTDHSTSSLNR